MKKKMHLQVLAFAVAGLFLPSCFLATISTTVSGRVTEYGEKPVAGAEITFGGTGTENVTQTDADGRFTVTAKHRPTQMLRLNVKKQGFVMKEKQEFPGFAAPKGNIEIELMQTIPRTR